MRLTNFILRSVNEFKDVSIITKDVLKLRIFSGHGGNGIPRFNLSYVNLLKQLLVLGITVLAVTEDLYFYV